VESVDRARWEEGDRVGCFSRGDDVSIGAGRQMGNPPKVRSASQCTQQARTRKWTRNRRVELVARV
jgi:hypothetical protein